MAIELIDKIKPKNGGDFPMVDAEDVLMPDGKRLSEFSFEDGDAVNVVTFDLVAMGLPNLNADTGEIVSIETDITQIVAAMQNNIVQFRVNVEYRGIIFKNMPLPMNPGGNMGVIGLGDNVIFINIIPNNGKIAAAATWNSFPMPLIADNDKIVQVVGGNLRLVKVEDSAVRAFVDERMKTQRAVLLEEKRYGSFYEDPMFGLYSYNFIRGSERPAVGEEIIVVWDGTEWKCIVQDLGNLMDGVVAVGNCTDYGGTDNNEPFIVGWIDTDMLALAFDQETFHTIGIYQVDTVATQSYVKSYVEQYISEALGGDY